jgi:hypothetical protein
VIFLFRPFLKKLGEMNHTETYSQDLILLDHVSPVDVAHEDITSCALVRLMGQTRGLVPMWRHVGLSRAKRTDATHEGVTPTTMTRLIGRIWLSSLSLSSSSLYVFLSSLLLTLWRLH